jgi:hypothetical protein
LNQIGEYNENGEGELTPIDPSADHGNSRSFQEQFLDQNLKDINGRVDESAQMQDQNEIELLNKIVYHIIDGKVTSMLKFMLQAYQAGLTKEVLDMISDEVKGSMQSKIMMLLQNAISTEDTQWFQVLGIDDPTTEQVEHFYQVTEAINEIFDNANKSKDQITVDNNLLDVLAQKILDCQELKMDFGNQVTQLTEQAKHGLETENSTAQLF